jgi:urease accessory protein
MTLHRASIHLPAGQWPQEKAAGSLTLDFETRHRRRFRMTTDQGDVILLDLPETVAMANGDGLQLEDGRWLKVLAAAEDIVEIRHENPLQFIRIAWHLGNRHLPTEIRGNVLCIRPDHVIEDMLRGFGAGILHVKIVFRPEGGAYGHVHDHNHHGDHHYHD